MLYLGSSVSNEFPVAFQEFMGNNGQVHVGRAIAFLTGASVKGFDGI